MKKVYRTIGACFLILIAVGIGMVVRYFTYDPDSGSAPIAKPVVTDNYGQTYLAVIDGDGTTYAVVTDGDGNRYAANFDGSQVGDTVGQINDQIKLEDVPGYTKGDIIDETVGGNFHGDVDQQVTTTQPTTVPATQGDTPEATTEAPEVTTTQAEVLTAYRIEKYSQIFKSGTYLMEFTTDDPDLPSVVMATKNGSVYMESAMELEEGSDPLPMKMIFTEDGTMYMLFDFMKKYSKMPQDMIGEDMDMTDMLSDFTDTGMGEITVSKVSINGQELILESYISPADGSTVNYYFDGDVLVRRDLVYSDGSKESIYFTRISTDVPDSYFEIPRGYSYFNLSWLGAFL